VKSSKSRTLALAAIAILAAALVVSIALFVRASSRAHELDAQRAMFCRGTTILLASMVRTGDTTGLERRMRAHYLDAALLEYCTGSEAPFRPETRQAADRCSMDSKDERGADRCFLELAREIVAAYEAARR
jgi:hypothetical protein